jgi:ATP-dependent DNA helicase RecQ
MPAENQHATQPGQNQADQPQPHQPQADHPQPHQPHQPQADQPQPHQLQADELQPHQLQADEPRRAEAETFLRALAGPGARLREDQWTAIRALVEDQRRALVVQRTGWGKSAVYFTATAMLRARGAGPSVIVSPLLALMRNQIDAAARAGIRARTVNSANTDEWEQVYAEVSAGAVDVLLVSPERLNNPGFRDLVLPKLIAAAGMLVVDEAHCISDWGHDFRPDYRRLATLLGELPPGVPVLATTATANARVTRDVAEQLGAGHEPETLVLRGPLDRRSLHLAVVELPLAQQRLAWLAEHLDELAGSGIIYTLTVAAAHDTASFLRERGFNVVPYTGRDEHAEREAAENSLLKNELKALVATSALGMGFDKPDLGFIIHLGAPQSPIAYYQQIGRAGRGVDRADVILLPGREDADIWAYFGSLAFPPEYQVRATLAALAGASRPVSTSALETRVDLSRSRLEMMLKVLDVDGAVRRVSGGWAATGQDWVYDADRYARVAAERSREQEAMLGYIATRDCRMEYLRRELDDPAAAPCGRCDNCTGRRWADTVAEADAQAAGERLLRPGVEITPRRMWPAGMRDLNIDASGKIAAEQSAEPGRVIGRLTDLGWGPRLRALLETDKPVPADMVDAAVRVLAAWDWAARPVGVAAMPSRSHPLLIDSMTRRIAEIGRLQYLGALAYAGPPELGGGQSPSDILAGDPGAGQPAAGQPAAGQPAAGQPAAGQPGSDRRGPSEPARQNNSAQRLRALWDQLVVPESLRDAIAHESGPVLLVDDRIETGWTMTVAAKVLRDAGAPAVLPFALAATTGG